MKDYYLMNKDFPQYCFAKNTTGKLNLTANEPLPLELSSSVGDDLAISTDGKYIEIGDNISRVRIYATLQFVSTGSATEQTMWIKRLRDSTISNLSITNCYGTNVSAEDTMVIYVKKGDKLYITSSRDCVINTSSTSVRSKLIVEKIC